MRDPPIISFDEESLLNVLLNGSDDFDDEINGEILVRTIYYIKSTKRFETLLIHLIPFFEPRTLFCLFSLSIYFPLYRSSHSKEFCKNDVLRNFAKFTRKHLRQSLFFSFFYRPVEMKTILGATNYVILSATMVGRRRKLFISNCWREVM